MKKIIFSAICSLWTMVVFAQSPEILWQNSFYLNGNDELTQESGYVAIGAAKSFLNQEDSSLVEVGILSASQQFSKLVVHKIDKWGNTIGYNTISGNSGRCVGQAILTDSSGGYWIAGSTSATGGEVIGSNDDLDIWLVHIDSSLNLIEQIRYENELEQGLNVNFIRTKDRGFLLSHTFRTDTSHTCPHADVQVIKFDEQFNVEWVRELGDHFFPGGEDWDQVKDVCQTKDEGFIFVGNTTSHYQDDGVEENRLWVFKLNPEGEIVWERIFSDLGTGYGSGIEELTDSLFLICGNNYCINCPGTQGNGLNGEAFLMAIDGLGNAVNHKYFGGFYADSFLDMKLLPNGHILLSGQTNSEDGDLSGLHQRGGFDIWIVECYSNWEIYSQWRFGGLEFDYPTDLQVIGNDEFTLVSQTESDDEWYGDVLNNPNKNIIIWTIKIGKRVEYTLGVEEQKLNLVLYPNPTSDVVHVKVPFSLMGAKYNVYNANGQRIMSSVFTSTDSLIDLSNLSSGTYTVSVPQWGWSKSILKEK
jgi:hypothetical protein